MCSSSRPATKSSSTGRSGRAAALEVDESLLTGESETVPKPPGAPVMSGSFVAAGSGRYQATKVGRDAYAVSLAEEARRFTLVHSELRAGIDRILTSRCIGIVPTAILLLISQLQAEDSVSGRAAHLGRGRRGDGARGTRAPDERRASRSESFGSARSTCSCRSSPPSKVLARVDILCLDKTGTLTEGSIVVQSRRDDRAGRGRAETRSARSRPRTRARTRRLLALRDAFVAQPRVAGRPARSRSRRLASGARSAFTEQGSWFLGAPDVLLPIAVNVDGDAMAQGAERVEEQARAGRAWCSSRSRPRRSTGTAHPPTSRRVALVLLEDKIRSDAAETLAYFAAQGVTIKVISGDHPATVAAVARRAGLLGTDEPVDARDVARRPGSPGRWCSRRRRCSGASLRTRSGRWSRPCRSAAMSSP